MVLIVTPHTNIECVYRMKEVQAKVVEVEEEKIAEAVSCSLHLKLSVSACDLASAPTSSLLTSLLFTLLGDPPPSLLSPRSSSRSSLPSPLCCLFLSHTYSLRK